MINRVRAFVLGGAGAFGRLFAHLLAAEGIEVYGTDLAQPERPALSKYARFVRGNVVSLDREAQELIADCQWIVACLPLEVTLSALNRVTPLMQQGSLFVDITSTKTTVVERMLMARNELEFLSLHPMFAPSLGFAGQNVAVLHVRPGSQSRRFEDLLRKWGAVLHVLTATEHDRIVAAVQVATHAAVLGFGGALQRMGYDIHQGLALSSPPHRALLALLARIVNGKPETYWQIQAENPFAEQGRACLQASCVEMDSIFSASDPQRFADLFESLRRLLGENNDPLADLAARLLVLPLAPDP